MKESPARVERYFRRLQDRRIVSILLIFCISLISLATFTDSIDKHVQFSKKYIFTSASLPKAQPEKDPELSKKFLLKLTAS
jgi:hypothetical protein